MTTPVVSIAYHSGYGHTAVLAEAVRDGAAETGATVHLIKVDGITEAEWELLVASDAIVFGSHSASVIASTLIRWTVAPASAAPSRTASARTAVWP